MPRFIIAIFTCLLWVSSAHAASLNLVNNIQSSLEVYVDGTHVGQIAPRSHSTFKVEAGGYRNIQISRPNGSVVLQTSKAFFKNSSVDLSIQAEFGTLHLNNSSQDDLRIYLNNTERGHISPGASRSFRIGNGPVVVESQRRGINGYQPAKVQTVSVAAHRTTQAEVSNAAPASRSQQQHTHHRAVHSHHHIPSAQYAYTWPYATPGVAVQSAIIYPPTVYAGVTVLVPGAVVVPPTINYGYIH